MKHLFIVTFILASVGCLAAERSLFNGTDLSGWEGAPGWWRVEDGAITSESTPEKPCKASNYLIWQGGAPKDFELSADFKLSAGKDSNSGIQIRSETRPNWDTYGYQADMTGDGGLVGFLYHHKGGLIAGRGEDVSLDAEGKRVVKKLGDPAELLKVYKVADWNTYRIVCRGPLLELHINGVLMSRFTGKDDEGGGIIALQMHQGPPMKVQFKNIVLKEVTE